MAATPPISVMNLRRTLPEMPRCEGRGQEGGGEKQRSGAPLDFGLGRTASSASTASSTYQPRHSSFATPAMPKARCPSGHSTPLNSPPVCRRRGHYETTFKLWQDKGIKLPPCFIIVCQNTATGRGLDDQMVLTLERRGFIRRKPRTARSSRVGSNRPSRPARLPPCR